MNARDWDEFDLDYNNAMGLALFCCQNDIIGAQDYYSAARNFAVIECEVDIENDTAEPMWHAMAWHGGFQGYDWLHQHCIDIGQIVVDDASIFS